MKKNATDKEIMEYLGVSRWTVRCARMRTFMSQAHHPANAEFRTHRTSDFHWGSRHNRTCLDAEIIGCDMAGANTAFYIWAYSELPE